MYGASTDLTGPGVAANRDQTIEAFLARSKRPAGVPVRRSFLQGGTQARPVPGPLARLISNRDPRALDLFLLLVAVASGGDFDVTAPSAVWGRAVGVPALTDPAAAVSKAWSRLESLHLVEKQRRGRLARVQLLREDGSGQPYEHPFGSREPYFKIPNAYWTDDARWYRTLSLPGRAMLLIALSLDDGFYLPFDKAKAWYGVSADTARAGIGELLGHDLLKTTTRHLTAPLSPAGFIERRHYTLRSPFDRAARAARPRSTRRTSA